MSAKVLELADAMRAIEKVDEADYGLGRDDKFIDIFLNSFRPTSVSADPPVNSFWPEGIDINDDRSPMEVLALAQAEWKEKSGGLLELEVKIVNLDPSYSLPIIRVFFRGEHLFQIDRNIYNDNKDEYPVAIVGATDPRLYCQNPLDFEEKLSQLLKSGAMKTTVVNALIKIKAETKSAVNKPLGQSTNIN
jgi:hypothetical protein